MPGNFAMVGDTLPFPEEHSRSLFCILPFRCNRHSLACRDGHGGGQKSLLMFAGPHCGEEIRKSRPHSVLYITLMRIYIDLCCLKQPLMIKASLVFTLKVKRFWP